MPLPIFGFMGARGNPGLRTPSVIGQGVRGGSGNISSKATGRGGVSPHDTTNAGSDVQVFQNYAFTTLGQSQTFPLPADGDFNAAIFTVAVTVSTSTQTTDVLNYFAVNGIEIVAADGPIIDMTPNPDFYLFQQRFGQYGVAPAVTSIANTTSATTGTAVFYVSGLNLPAAQGPYTLNVSIAGTNPGGTAGSFTNVTMSLSLVIGTCPNGLRTRYKANALPFTPAANGTQDLAPLAAIQGPTLQELFITGLTSNTADIAYLQIQSTGSTIGTRTPSAGIVARDVAALSGTLNATYLYPLLAFHTGLVLSRAAHFYITWGATPSSTIRIGYYWLE